MQTPNKPVSDKRLDSFTFVAKLIDEYEVALGFAVVYSYMLCKFTWFRTQGRQYYESQEKIAEGCRVSSMTVKKAIKWLSSNGFIDVSKKKGALYYNNQYFVHDKYSVYNKVKQSSTLSNPKPQVRKMFIAELEDAFEGEPF
jgi:hypothetical protein